MTEQPRRTDTDGIVHRAVRDRLVATGQLSDDEDITMEIVVVKVRRRGPDGPTGPCRRLYFAPLSVDSDEASSALSVVSEQLRSGGASPA